MLYEMGDRL